MPAAQPRDVRSAGVVVFRPGKQVLLVHRPKYDDWSFPKGKIDRGEHVVAAAAREVAEETGLAVRLGAPLTSQRYPIAKGMKSVSYWTGRVLGDDDVSGYQVNAEIDDVRWVEVDKAKELLTYPYDVETLREARRLRARTQPVVLLRHGAARSRKVWRQDDRLRPLLQPGRAQALRLVPVLAAYGISRVVTSSSMRCLETVTPYADAIGGAIELEDRLSEEEATERSVARIVADLLQDGQPVLVCTHRPVFPAVFETLGLDDPGLDTGEMLVAHVRKGKVVATERHLVT
jgi:8-oxo-dGTP diphosphatase